MCAGAVIHSLGYSKDIRFTCGLSIYIYFTSSSSIVPNFAFCGTPFLAGFYSRDFILEMFSMRYKHTFGSFLLLVSTGLAVCYSFRLFYFVLCGYFNFVDAVDTVLCAPDDG
jgi:NADH:ubiquinone oxidoreductase subunit 5 (subunit L)/multisubunit Na+/H+ antiporter MnhA subunit